MPYATENGITQADMSEDPAWIEISDEDYMAALEGIQNGKRVSIGNGFELVAVEVLPDPEESEAAQRLSSLVFFELFTDAEYQAVRTHSSFQLQRGLDSLIAAQFINLEDPRVVYYLDALIAGGVINEARKAELLGTASQG